MGRFSLQGDHGINGEEVGPSSGTRCPQKKQKTTATGTTPDPPPGVLAPPLVDRDYQMFLGDCIPVASEANGDGELDGTPLSASSLRSVEDESDGSDEDSEEADVEEPENQQQEGVNVGETSGDGSLAVTLTEPDVLDCPICLEPLSIPVFQCENGHIACSLCCARISNKCPTCSSPIGYSRCRALEKVLEVVKVSCGNMKYGCKDMIKYCDKHKHENACFYAPCSCPVVVCDFVGPERSLYVHCDTDHEAFGKGKSFVFNRLFSVSVESYVRHLILLERTERMIFVLNHFSEDHTSAVNLVRIAPALSRRKFSYDLTAKGGETSITLQSFAESIPKVVDSPPSQNFLLVPNYIRGTSERLKLDVCIWRHESSRPVRGENMV